MKNKVKYLIKTSFMKKIHSKQFKIANIFIALLVICLLNIDTIISFFGGDFNEIQQIQVVDNIGTYDEFKTLLNSTSTSNVSTTSNYNVSKIELSVEDAKTYVKEHPKEWIIIFNPSTSNYMEVSIISETYIATIDYQVLSSTINTIKQNYAINKLGIDESILSSISEPATINRILIDESKKSGEENVATIMTSVFPLVILPFFMLVILVVQMIGSEINDEKTSRGMEIIIGNVSPRAHFLSKVASANLFVLFQSFLLFIYAIIGVVIHVLTLGSVTSSDTSGMTSTITEALNNSAVQAMIRQVLPVTIILMLLTFLAYSLLSGILASITTSAEDLQQMQMPMLMILLVGYYLAIMAGMFKGSIVIRVLSYVPLLSAMLTPSLLALGDISLIDIIISIVLLVLFIYIILKYGMNIYKEGILNYSSKGLWKKMWKSAKESK